MANLIKKTLFERPSHPQTAPLGKVPLGLLEVQDFYAAWYSETQSFRSLEREKLSLSQHLTQPQFSWLFVPLNLIDVPVGVAAWMAHTQSFRSREGSRLDLNQHLTQPQLAWLQEPLGLTLAKRPIRRLLTLGVGR